MSSLAMTFSNLKISVKILIILVLVAVSSVGIFGFFEYQATTESLRSASFDKLTAVREMKAQQIEDYFKTINRQIITFAESETSVRAAQSFRLAFNKIQGQETPRKRDINTPDDFRENAETLADYYRTDFLTRFQQTLVGNSSAEIEQFLPKVSAVQRLQSLYISKNPYPTGEKHKLEGVGDGSIYDELHQRYHPGFRSFLEKFGFYDMFLIEPENGHIVYSVYKEVDFATSLLNGPYKDSNFASVFRKAREADSSEAVFLADFEPYKPSYNAPAAFIASPIIFEETLVGVIAFQMPIDRINDIMTSHNAWKDVGLGASGETYIVGNDYLMRNQSRFLIEDRENYLAMIRSVGTLKDTIRQIEYFDSSIGLQKVETKGTIAALAGQSNTEIFPDYRGVNVLSSYRPLRLLGLEWAIMSEIDEAEAFAAVDALKHRIILLGGVLLALIVVVSFVFARTITHPIKILTKKAEALAEGDLGVEIDTRGGDEIAVLAGSFAIMRNSLRESIVDLEEKVRQRTAELQAIMDSANDALISMDDSGDVILWNPAAEKMFGRSAKNMLGNSLTAIIPERHRGAHEAGIRRLSMNEEPQVVGKTLELAALREDGSEFPIGLSIGTWTVGERRYFNAVIRDITDRKEAEKALSDQYAQLEESQSNLRLALDQLESVNSVILRWNTDGLITGLNSFGQELFGFTDSEVVGQHIVGTIIPQGADTDDKLRKMTDDILKDPEKYRENENMNLRKDGSPVWMMWRNKPIVAEDGSLEAILSVGIDITDRKEAEKALADQLALIEALVDTMPNPVFVRDTETRYTILNKALLKSFAIEREDLLGKTDMDFERNPIELRRELQQEAEELIQTGGMIHKETTRRYADGNVHDVLYWETAFKLSDGNVGGLVGIHVDITKLKELERELEIANKRMGDELNIGRQIQMSMIPLTFPRFPEHKDIDVWAYLRPAREVGGDFYDFFFINERLFAFVIADVSGKGVPAALLMAVAKTLIKSHSYDTRSTARILELTNNELSQNNKDCMFITAFLGIIDTKDGTMTYTNAGHNPPFLISPDGDIKALTKVHGPMVGAIEGISYEEENIVLGVDDKLILYTDGITEAFDDDGQDFGEKRLATLLDRSKNLGTKYLVDALVQEVDEFVGEAPQSDDITVFCLRHVAWEEREDRARIELHLENDLSEIERCLEALTEFCNRFDLPQSIRSEVGIVLDDILNNVISYAFDDEEIHLIEVSLATDKERFIITVSDDGVEFDPFTISEPDTNADIDERQIGGLGIHLVRNLMDDYSYRRIDGKNMTILMKRMGDLG